MGEMSSMSITASMLMVRHVCPSTTMHPWTENLQLLLLVTTSASTAAPVAGEVSPTATGGSGDGGHVPAIRHRLVGGRAKREWACGDYFFSLTHCED